MRFTRPPRGQELLCRRDTGAPPKKAGCYCGVTAVSAGPGVRGESIVCLLPRPQGLPGEQHRVCGPRGSASLHPASQLVPHLPWAQQAARWDTARPLASPTGRPIQGQSENVPTFLISELHSGAVVSYLGCLTLIMEFSCPESCSNWCFGDGLDVRNSYTSIFMYVILPQIPVWRRVEKKAWVHIAECGQQTAMLWIEPRSASGFVGVSCLSASRAAPEKLPTGLIASCTRQWFLLFPNSALQGRGTTT